MRTNRFFVRWSSALVLIVSVSAVGARAAAPSRSNILLIVSDDHGYADVVPLFAPLRLCV